jgi:hypothetical protein
LPGSITVLLRVFCLVVFNNAEAYLVVILVLLKTLPGSIAGGMAGVSPSTVLYILLCVSIAYVVTPEFY